MIERWDSKERKDDIIHKIVTFGSDMSSLLLKSYFNVVECCFILCSVIAWCWFNPCVHLSLTLICCNCIIYRWLLRNPLLLQQRPSAFLGSVVSGHRSCGPRSFTITLVWRMPKNIFSHELITDTTGNRGHEIECCPQHSSIMCSGMLILNSNLLLLWHT